MRVLVINQCAGNKGDRAIAYFVMRELYRNGITSTVMSTSDRRLWRNTSWLSEYGVELAPWGWNVERVRRCDRLTTPIQYFRRQCQGRLYAVLRHLVDMGAGRFWLPALSDGAFLRGLKGTDLVVSTGGHHVTTLLSKDAVSPQLYDMGLALLAGRPLVLWSQSIGPLDFVDARNDRYVRNILRRTSLIFLRDQQSEEVLRRIDLNGSSVRRTFDSVIGLNDLCQEYVPASQRSPSVGIAVYTAQHRPPEERIRYIRTMAALVDHAFTRGLQVRLFPMETEGTGADDRPLIREILREAKQSTHVTIEPDMETAQHLREVAKCQLFVGHKTHSVIFALTVGTPLLALAYHPKTQDFMRQYGLEPFCISDRNLEIDALLERFDLLAQKADENGASAFEKSREFGRKVRTDFAALLNLVGLPLGADGQR